MVDDPQTHRRGSDGVALARAYQLVLVVIVGLILAVALDPIVRRLERLGLPRWLAAIAISVLIAAGTGGFLWATWATLSDQGSYLGRYLDDFVRNAIALLPSWMRDAVETSGGSTAASFAATHLVSLARSVCTPSP